MRPEGGLHAIFRVSNSHARGGSRLLNAGLLAANKGPRGSPFGQERTSRLSYSAALRSLGNFFDTEAEALVDGVRFELLPNLELVGVNSVSCVLLRQLTDARVGHAREDEFFGALNNQLVRFRHPDRTRIGAVNAPPRRRRHDLAHVFWRKACFF